MRRSGFYVFLGFCFGKLRWFFDTSCEQKCALKAACHTKRPAWQRQHFPMWVLKVSNLLQTLGLWVNLISLSLEKVTAWVSGIWQCFPRMTKMHSHQKLRAANLLVEHRSSFFTIFVSHQWMSRTHPDPSGDWASSFWTFWVENCFIDRKVCKELANMRCLPWIVHPAQQ